MVMIVYLDGLTLKNMMKDGNPANFELAMAKYIDGYSQFWNIPENKWFHNVVTAYSKEESKFPVPQLSVGAWITAGLTVNAMASLILLTPSFLKIAQRLDLIESFARCTLSAISSTVNPLADRRSTSFSPSVSFTPGALIHLSRSRSNFQ